MNAPTCSILGSGPTVLMLHGIGGGHLNFAPQLETFASAGYRAVAWDAPGYGHSDPIEPYTFKGLAQACATLIEQLKCDRPPAIVGHSMGGMVAQELAARRPDLVGRLVLCGTSASFGRKPDGSIAEDWARDFVSQRTAPLDAGASMADVARKVVPQMIGPGALPEGVRLAEQCMARVPAATYRRAIAALVTFDRAAALAAIAVPTLLVAGEFDRNASPASMQRMAAAIPGARYAQLKGVGHLMNLEAPDEFDACVLDFLAQTSAQALQASLRH